MLNNETPKETIHQLANGRTYKVVDTRTPYIEGEYPTGGFVIHALLQHSKEWSYIDNSPDASCVQNFLNAASRLPSRPH